MFKKMFVISLVIVFGLMTIFKASAESSNLERLNYNPNGMLLSGDQIWIGSDYSGKMDDQIEVEVWMSNETIAVDAFTMDVLFDNTMLEFIEGYAGDLNPGWVVFDAHEYYPGFIRVYASSLPPNKIPAGSEGVLVVLVFDVTCYNCDQGDTSELIPHNLQDDIAGFAIETGMFTFIDPEPKCLNHGDVNLDGQITAADAQLAFFIVLGQYSPTFEEDCAADCNSDGFVSAADAQAIFLVILLLTGCADPLVTPTPTIPPTITPFVTIPAGMYTRGSQEDEPCRTIYESQHQVTLTHELSMMTTEVTRQLWEDLKAAQPTLPNDPSDTYASPTMNHPMQNNTWYEALLFANLMSLWDGYTRSYYKDEALTIPVDASNYSSGSFYCNFDASGYRLPTEAEWEYACRAGTIGPFSCGEPDYNSDNCYSCTAGTHPILEQYCVYCATAPVISMIVGSKLANPWGLYDMHGNVWEWCWDWCDDYPSGPVTDPAGPSSGSSRVIRGGGWYFNAFWCRSAFRSESEPDSRYYALGFRLVRTAP